jgi:hypothetical protein
VRHPVEAGNLRFDTQILSGNDAARKPLSLGGSAVNLIMISFDLKAPFESYSTLGPAIDQLGANRLRCHNNAWFVETEMTQQDIVDELRRHIAQADKFAVAPIANGFASLCICGDCLTVATASAVG